MIQVAVFHGALLSSLVFTSLLANGSANWSQTLLSVCVAYGVVYLYGLMSVTVFMAALRAIAEHQRYDADSAAEGYAALRNFKCNPVSRYMMGAYGFGEHFTHHVVPGIPYYHLKAATAALAAENAMLSPQKDYFQVLAEIVAHGTANATRADV
jgi:fatty acid desaturase